MKRRRWTVLRDLRLRNCQWSLFCALRNSQNQYEKYLLAVIFNALSKKAFEIEDTWNSMETRSAPCLVNARRTSAIVLAIVCLVPNDPKRELTSSSLECNVKQLFAVQSEASLGEPCAQHVFSRGDATTLLDWQTKHRISDWCSLFYVHLVMLIEWRVFTVENRSFIDVKKSTKKLKHKKFRFKAKKINKNWTSQDIF